MKNDMQNRGKHAAHAAPSSAPRHVEQISADEPRVVPATKGVQSTAKNSRHALSGKKESSTSKKSAKGKKKRSVWSIVFYIALAVFIVSAGAIGVIFFNYYQADQNYKRIANEFTDFNVQDISMMKLSDIRVDWDALYEVNPDTVAWVVVPGTRINYPVVHTTDDYKYLKTDFEGETNWVVSDGAIFLEADCEGDFSSTNNFIYGHNMNDGSMFSDIVEFADSTYFEQHRSIILLTPQGNYRLTAFAIDHVSAVDDLVQPEIEADSTMPEYVEHQIERSEVEAKDLPSAAAITRVFVFLTCDNLDTNGRYALFAYIAESTVPGVNGLESAMGVASAALAAGSADATESDESEDSEE